MTAWDAAPPHLFRTLQYVVCFELSIGSFKKVLGCLYVFVYQQLVVSACYEARPKDSLAMSTM